MANELTMNRDIRFRAWGLDKMWSPEKLGMNAYLIEPSGKGLFSLHSNGLSAAAELRPGDYPTDYVLMQYTGLEDENGVEIYEGDVVRPTDKRVSLDGCIIYANAQFEVSTEGYKNKLLTALLHDGGDALEVIGNIYDNPELSK